MARRRQSQIGLGWQGVAYGMMITSLAGLALWLGYDATLISLAFTALGGLGGFGAGMMYKKKRKYVRRVIRQ